MEYYIEDEAESLIAGDGAVFSVPLVITNTVVSGTYRVMLSNQSVTTVDGDKEINAHDFASTLIIKGADISALMRVGAGNVYGTFCAPFDVKVPSDVKVYTATLSGTTIVLDEVTGTLPAGSAAIVEYEPTDLYEQTFTGTPAVAGETCTTGCLVGTFTKQEVAEGNFVLQNHSGHEAFYRVASPGVYTRTNGCYLTAGGSNARAFYFDDETAIAALKDVLNGEADIYNAAGMKTSTLQKGVNIVRGVDGNTQKVMVK